MSVGDKQFSHISVSSDDDDEIVIEAGLRHEVGAKESTLSAESAQDAEESAQDAEELAQDTEELAQEAEEYFAEESNSIAEHELDVEPLHDTEPTSPTNPAKSQRMDDYVPTTLEDLENSSMSGMQKAIIAIALVGIVAALVYYFFFLG